MNQGNQSKLNRLLERVRQHRHWRRTIAVMVGAVALCTAAALTLPAISMEHEYICGMEEHQHGPECYAEHRTLICGMVDTSTEEFKASGVHVHTDACYETVPVLICGQEESEGHHHGPECYQTVKVPVCGMEEGEVHHHTDACYEERQKLICGQEESEEHHHGPECYETERVLICGMEEGEVHHHTDACMEERQELICGLEESEGHHHTAECYGEEKRLICPLEGVPEHVHTDECYEITQELICDKPEHIHTDACRGRSDDSADVENADIWEATFADVELTGRWDEDVLAIARTQLGYQESTRNFALDGNGNRMGYTRYGAWYGSPYAHWCAMFTSFCMHYAQIPEDVVPQDGGCDSWRIKLDELGLYEDADACLPQAGDLVFFDHDGNGSLDHVGLVEEVLFQQAEPAAEVPEAVPTAEGGESIPAPVPADEQGAFIGIRTIEGNSGEQVQRAQYDAGNTTIAGYGRIAAAQERYELMLEQQTDQALLNPKYEYEDGQLHVSVSIEGLVEPLPEDTRLLVTPITNENYPDEARAAEISAERTLLDDQHLLTGFSLFDLSLVSGGQRLPLDEKARVSVEAEFSAPLFDESAADQSASLHTLVLEELVDPVAAAPAVMAAPPAAPAPEEAEPAEPAEPAESAAPEEPAEPEEPGSAPEDPAEQAPAEQDPADGVPDGPAPEESAPAEPAPAAPAPALDQLSSTEVEGSYSGVEQGVTRVAYHSKGLSPFAVLLTSQVQSGTFWKVCRDVSSREQFQNGANYLVVSVEGSYALTNNLNGGKNYTAVELQPVKGNPDYYIIENVPAKAIWQYTGKSNGVGALAQGRFSNKTFISPSLSALFDKQDIKLKFSGSKTPAAFHLHDNTFTPYECYLSYRGDQQTFTTNSNQYLLGDEVNTSDLLILKQVDETLTIPDDAVAPDGGDGSPGSAQKPGYPGYIVPSGEKTGTYENAGMSGTYASDPSTAQLESQFGAHPLNGRTDYEAQQPDNGKALMDKSVIYGQDDYGAFPTYEEGVFSVTLSALGQAFVADTTTTTMPLDVLFILDLSNSMNETDKNQGKPRAKILVEALNRTVDHIMRASPENRICMVGFNSGASDILPLGHYEKNAQGLYFDSTSREYDDFGLPRIVIQPVCSPNAREKDCRAGTYTQMGIAQGYDLLMRSTPNPSDTTYTTTVNGESVTRPRKPVVILISDGEPTHCTSHYMDVLHSPYYGDGLAPISNGKGVHGYYTILSANYYKRMIGIHYNNPAAMYTVAFGMKEEDYEQVSGSAATNHYRATVMNPTPSNIEKLRNVQTTTADEVEQALYHMLQGDYNGLPQRVGGLWDLIPSLGEPHGYVPILKNNPYRGNYSYADKAYLNNEGNKGFDDAFDDIIKQNIFYDFRYKTQKTENHFTSLDLSDPIGEGMEVKGEPVLRVNGTNYTPVSRAQQGTSTVYGYTGVVPMDPYSGRTVDLSLVRVRVETDPAGLQTVKMEIPPEALPTYTADRTTSFYYEALPIRLIYQVGLSPAGQQTVDSLPVGESATFYTNRYVGEPHAIGLLKPASDNPFYKGWGWRHKTGKTSNPTATDGYSLDLKGNAQKVQFVLGNNGKLTLSRTAPAVQLAVKKVWQDYDGNEKTEDLPEKITATLYRTYAGPDGQPVREDVITDFELSAANGWKRTFSPAELKEVPGRVYKYYVDEAAVEGYRVSYSGDGVSIADEEHPITLTNRYRYGDFFLPQTGGPGTALFTVSGLALMGGCLVYLYASRRRHSERRSK